MTRRETWVAYFLLIVGGYIGLHKFYLNRVGWGLAYLLAGGFCLVGLFTLGVACLFTGGLAILSVFGLGLPYLLAVGFCLIGLVIDLFTLPWQVEACNRELGWVRYATASHLPACPEAERRAEALGEADRKLQDFTRRLNNLEAVIDAKRD